MSPEERMTINERRKYLHKMRIRYWQAKNRAERSQLLDEMEAVTELHRKSVLRLIHGELARKPRRKQRGKTYGPPVKAVLERIAESLDYPCAERLQPNLVWLARHLERHGEVSVSPEVEQQLAQISVSTLRRLLGPVGERSDRVAHRKARPSVSQNSLRGVPMQRIRWDETQPGHFEVDLVHHGGGSSEGQYIHTLQLIDVATGWSECIPVLGRSYLVMQDGFTGLLKRLPFPILELHPDNGSEFFNVFLVKFWKEQIQAAQLSRSRPFHKNDNRFVEENNFSLVRAYVGYQRLDTRAHLQVLHRLYNQLWLYHNLFQPVLRLKHKVRTNENSAYKRIYQEAQSPLDRLCHQGGLSVESQRRLLALRAAINPAQVRRSIEELTIQLFNLPLAKEGVVEDVRQTLGLWQSEQLFNVEKQDGQGG